MRRWQEFDSSAVPTRVAASLREAGSGLAERGHHSVGRSGVVAAEMAIVTPFVMFMFVVAVDYCRVYYAVQVVNNAARCGALYASGTVPAASGLTPLQAAQQAAAAEAVSLNPPLQAANVTLTSGTNNVAVTVKYSFKIISPYLGLPSQLGLTATVTMPMSVVTTQ